MMARGMQGHLALKWPMAVKMELFLLQAYFIFHLVLAIYLLKLASILVRQSLKARRQPRSQGLCLKKLILMIMRSASCTQLLRLQLKAICVLMEVSLVTVPRSISPISICLG